MRINPGKIWYWSTRAHHRGYRRTARLLKWLNFLMFRNLLPCEAKIFPDISLEHFALCTVVHPNVTIGRRVRLFHHVTLATESVIGSEHRIFIGDDVVIGAGAIVIGRGNQSLMIGNGAVIGAGSVVTHDVECGNVVVGSPARVIKNTMLCSSNADSSGPVAGRNDASVVQIGRNHNG
jgi:serine O-acetyltransferase